MDITSLIYYADVMSWTLFTSLPCDVIHICCVIIEHAVISLLHDVIDIQFNIGHIMMSLTFVLDIVCCHSHTRDVFGII